MLGGSTMTTMTTATSLAPLLERFFTQRLMQQRQASPHTIRSYRDTFRQLLLFVQQRLHQPPSRLHVEQIDAPLIVAFLDELENRRGVSLLSRPEVDALLATPDRSTWSGRRDYVFILTAVQTGLRLSEMTGLKREDLILGAGAHVRVTGKGRKERCIPLAKSTRTVLQTWLQEPPRGNGDVLFPSARGQRLSVHGVQYLLNKHRLIAGKVCGSLLEKRVTVHCLRHTMAMDLLQGGVDRSVIALWLGHESVETTQIYLEATLAMKEQALAKTAPPQGKLGRYQPGDQLLNFLNSL